MAVHEVVVLLDTHVEVGLSPQEAERRLQLHGPNRLPEPRRQSAVVRFLAQLNNPLIYVLAAAGVAAALLGEVVDATVIAAVVVVNTVIGFVQEQRAQSALDALTAMVERTTTVVRAGQTHELATEHVVPGDVVLHAEGARVPADLRLTVTEELSVDESTLTGESLPVTKASGEVARTSTSPSFHGSLVPADRSEAR